jgi:hypothetical protein
MKIVGVRKFADILMLELDHGPNVSELIEYCKKLNLNVGNVKVSRITYDNDNVTMALSIVISDKATEKRIMEHIPLNALRYE